MAPDVELSTNGVTKKRVKAMVQTACQLLSAGAPEVNIDQLERFETDSEISPETLSEKRIIRDVRKPVVLLGRGDVDSAFNVKVHRISKNAKTKIEAAGGSVEIIE